jgi:hypothetical protein
MIRHAGPSKSSIQSSYMADLQTDVALIGHGKDDFDSVLATFAGELKTASDRAEGFAKQIQDYYPKDSPATIKAREAYIDAQSLTNGLSLRVQGVLIGSHAPKNPIDSSAAVTALNAFKVEYHKLFDHYPHFWVAVVPSLSDIGKIIDSIMGIIKYFLDRKDKQRQQMADLLATTELREWGLVGTARPERKSTATQKDAEGKKKNP